MRNKLNYNKYRNINYTKYSAVSNIKYIDTVVKFLDLKQGDDIDLKDGAYILHFDWVVNILDIQDNKVVFHYNKYIEPVWLVNLMGKYLAKSANWAPWISLYASVIVKNGIVVKLIKLDYYDFEKREER